MAEFVLNAEVRTNTGKGPARRSRAEGLVPAVIYGKGVEKPVHCLLKRREVDSTLSKANRNAIVKVDFSGKDAREVIFREVQKHPITHRLEHLDFQAIDHAHPIRVEVSINLVGEPIGRKAGAILTTQLRTLRVECLPDNIPAQIDLDVTALDVGDSLHVSDIPKAAYKVISNPKFTVCQMSVVKEEVVAVVPGAVAADGTVAPAVAGAVPAEGAAAPAAAAGAKPAVAAAKPAAGAKPAAPAAKKEGK